MSDIDRLFTPRFFLMCGFTFTVFLSAFQLIPTAPFHILALGGTATVAGLFLGLLTYSSAFSGPLTGAMADRLGKRRVLIAASMALTVCSLIYAVLPGYRLMLALVLVHGVFWSALLTASAAYMTDQLPPQRRAEGFGYWGLSTALAVAFAPAVGLWVFERGGWSALCIEAAALNVSMAIIAWFLPADTPKAEGAFSLHPATLVEWRMVGMAFTLFLYSFGYGGVTSFVAVYADQRGIVPRSIFFTVFSGGLIITRPFIMRLADRVGYLRVFFPCMGLIVLAYLTLSQTETRTGMIGAAALFALGFGSAYPLFVAYIMKHVSEARRGAAFGGIIGAFDTGIGTGSIAMGTIIERAGFGAAFLTAAALSAFAVPYFLFARSRFLPLQPAAPSTEH